MIRADEWALLAMGIGGFVVCIISDFVSLRAKKSAVALFFAGTTIIAVATAGCLFVYTDLSAAFQEAPVLRGCAAVGGLVFIGLTVYAIAFVPKENYKKSKGTLIDTGLYALCRHPGVWCLGGAYLCVGLMAGSPLMWAVGAANMAMDLIYVVFEDIFIFPRTIDQYVKYKARVPFLIPNKQSIRRAFIRKKASLGGTEQ